MEVEGFEPGKVLFVLNTECKELLENTFNIFKIEPGINIPFPNDDAESIYCEKYLRDHQIYYIISHMGGNVGPLNMLSLARKVNKVEEYITGNKYLIGFGGFGRGHFVEQGYDFQDNYIIIDGLQQFFQVFDVDWRGASRAQHELANKIIHPTNPRPVRRRPNFRQQHDPPFDIMGFIFDRSVLLDRVRPREADLDPPPREREKKRLKKNWEEILKDKKELVESTDENQCCILCYTYEKSILFKPCNHMIACDLCVRKIWESPDIIHRCPSCNDGVEKIVRPIK